MKERIKLPPCIDENATIDDLRFIFLQAQAKVNEQTGDAEKLYQRSVVLATLCIASVTAIIGYLGSNASFKFGTFWLTTIGIIMWVVLSLLKENLLPKDYWGAGSEPASLATEAFFTLVVKTSEWHMLCSEIISYQQRIEVNKENNNIRAETLKDAIRWLYWIPPISLLVLVVCTIFRLI